MTDTSMEKSLTLTVLGCGESRASTPRCSSESFVGLQIINKRKQTDKDVGNMCLAILDGIFQELTSKTPKEFSTKPSTLPSKFIACIRSDPSAKRIDNALSKYNLDLQIAKNDNLTSLKAADVVLLGCKPYMVNDLLGQEGMREALAGKLLISVCAGVPVEQMEKALYGGPPSNNTDREHRCRLVRALPNMASMIRQGMTVVATSAPALPEEDTKLITWMFECVGEVMYLAPNMMDISTALAGSAGPFFSLILEGAVDGAVAMGMPRADALKMASTTMRGTAELVLSGEHPAVFREKASSPGGCTIGGLLVLEEAGARGNMAKALREATVVASKLGAGVKNVNAPRP